MTGKTHMAIGITAGLAMSAGQTVETQLILVISSAVGSLVPDIDHPKAKLNQKLLFLKNEFYRVLFYLSLTGGSIYLYLKTGNTVFGLLSIMTFFTGISNHRGFTHSIIGFLTAISIVKIVALKYKLPMVYSGFTLGYLLHLVADFFTVKGIKLFYPLNKNVSSPIMIKTDNNLENVIFALLSIYSMFFLLNSLNI